MLFSCVSNKKHLAEIESLTAIHQKKQTRIENNFQAADKRATQLELKLAEEAGVNRALAGMQRIYMKEIDSLQNAMTNLGSSAQTTQQDLDQRLQQRDQKIEDLGQKITEAKAVIANRGENAKKIISELAEVLSLYESTEAVIDQQKSKVRIQLFDKMMFQSGKMRIRTKGGEALTKIASVLTNYPTLTFQVIGHTDNKTIRGYKDKWAFSALRGAAVVQYMTDELGINRNQIIACGMGEFQPRDSNETSEGRANNRRVEIIIEEAVNETMRKMNKVLE